jgi:allantoinase
MAFPRDQIPYSAIIDRPTLRLPKSARVVVWTIINVEVWDIQAPMPRTVLPPARRGSGHS